MQPVVFNASLQEALNLIGAFVFAISGALLAVHKRYDIVGMIVLAEITAIGGGVIRDLILGAVPPASFTDHVTFLLPLGAVALVFVVYRYVMPDEGQGKDQDQGSTSPAHTWRYQMQTAFAQRYRNQLRIAVLIFDAAGLAVFCVSGAAKAIAYGLGPVEAIALGALTGVGGGILRDMLANDKPAVLQEDSELYVVPAILGGAIVVVVHYLHLEAYSTLAATLAAVFVFALRLAALRYRWTAPRPWRVTATKDNPAAVKQDDAQE